MSEPTHVEYEDHHAEHPGPRAYVWVAILLALVTTIEVAIYYFNLPDWALVAGLVVFAVIERPRVVRGSRPPGPPWPSPSAARSIIPMASRSPGTRSSPPPAPRGAPPEMTAKRKPEPDPKPDPKPDPSDAVRGDADAVARTEPADGAALGFRAVAVAEATAVSVRIGLMAMILGTGLGVVLGTLAVGILNVMFRADLWGRGHESLDLAIVTNRAAPILIALLSAPMLGERVNTTLWGATLLGFAGMLVIMSGRVPVAVAATINCLDPRSGGPVDPATTLATRPRSIADRSSCTTSSDSGTPPRRSFSTR